MTIVPPGSVSRRSAARSLLPPAVLCLCVSAPAVTLDSAGWAPDHGTSYAWFENAKDLQSFFSQDYRASGHLRLQVRNGGTRPATATGFRLDGRELDALRRENRVLWWRLLPDPIPAGGMAEVVVRPRAPLLNAVKLEVTFDDGSTVSAEIVPTPVPLRLGTVGFTAKRDQVFLVVERLTDSPQRLTRLELDGRDVSRQCRFLDPDFRSGVAPVVLSLDQPLELGSYHLYSVQAESGARTGECLRTGDAWVPLGTYGYGDYEEFARNGCNGHANFSKHSAEDLEVHALLGMRAVTTVGARPPEPYMLGHAGLWAYYLQDEPDCADYGVKDLPVGERVGWHAMEMERRRQTCAQADPSRPTFLTIDMTFKPANYFIYGPIADIPNVDCYPLSIGADARLVREVVETCRRGAGPRPLTFTFQGCFEEHDDAQTREKQRFPRPPFAEEERLMMYYAISAGARGLFDYIHCSERAATYMSHGSKEYVDVWAEIGRVYRELRFVAPLLALAHPTALATAESAKLAVSTLVCGGDALLLVCINEDYEQQRTAYRFRPLRNARVCVPRLPWLAPAAAWCITEAGARPVAMQTAGTDAVLTLDRVDVAEMLLVSSNPTAVDALAAASGAAQQRLGAALLGDWRRRQRAEADRVHKMRRLAGEFLEYVVIGRSVGAYGMHDPGYWNPTRQEPNWMFEFGENDKTAESSKGAEWSVDVPQDRAGQEHTVCAMLGAWGQPAALSVLTPGGQELLRREFAGGWTGTLVAVKLRLPEAGTYTVRYLQGGTGPKGGRIATAIYVIPASAGPPELE